MGAPHVEGFMDSCVWHMARLSIVRLAVLPCLPVRRAVLRTCRTCVVLMLAQMMTCKVLLIAMFAQCVHGTMQQSAI